MNLSLIYCGLLFISMLRNAIARTPLHTAQISALRVCTTTIITHILFVTLVTVIVYSFFEVKIIVEQDIRADNILRCIGAVIDIKQVRELTKRPER